MFKHLLHIFKINRIISVNTFKIIYPNFKIIFIINSTDLPKIVKIIEAKLYIIFTPPTIIILYISVPIKYKIMNTL